jgi:hypothetical protein
VKIKGGAAAGGKIGGVLIVNADALVKERKDYKMNQKFRYYKKHQDL